MNVACLRAAACAAIAVIATLVLGVSPAAAVDITFVSSTTPAADATNVPVDSNLSITFNQPVNVTDPWAQMFCTKSGSHGLVASGGPQTWQLVPQGARTTSEVCAVTIDASKVSGMLLNYTFTFSTADALPVNTAPTADAGGPYVVDEGGSLLVSASGSDPDGDPLSYAWDLDANGTFETAGQSATFTAGSLDGPDIRTISVRVSDDGGLSGVDDAEVTINNVAPTATFTAPATAFAGTSFSLELTGASDPSAADVAAGFTFAFDCGDGYAAFTTDAQASCDTGAATTLLVGAKIQDKDGDVTEYRATVSVAVTFEGLCELVHAYSSKPAVTQALCTMLAHAEAAETPEARAGVVDAFQNAVEAQAGKAFSNDHAQLLTDLAQRLGP